MADGSVKIGSLELLQPSDVLTLFNTSDPARRTGSVGEETAVQVRVDIPDAAYDLVIMNPPFTRATNHEGAHANVTNPVFAAFNATRADQTEMGERANRLADNTCYHGNAGIASAFAALAHKKLKPGGVLALVLPLSVANGLSWQGFRQMLSRHYMGLTVLTIAAAHNNHLSFSADTGMAECLVIVRKRTSGKSSGGRSLFASLRRRPQGFSHASAVAKGVLGSNNVRSIGDGPYGGTSLVLGAELAGEAVTAPIGVDGEKWGAVRLADYSVAQTAYAFSKSQLWLPGKATAFPLRMTSLGKVGKLGLVDRDITGPAPRGPFDKTAPIPTATYPALWSHDAQNETRIVCTPDSQLQVRQGMEEKAAAIWATASRAHISRGVGFGSQPLAVALTEQRSAGGRGWPNITFGVPEYDFAFALWGNSTLGLISYWWHSNRQFAGRGDMTIRSAETLPILDLRTLTDAQLATAQTIFDDFRDKEFKPAYLADADPTRALLDKRVLCDLLGFDEDVYKAVRRLAAKWCAEPSVHGGKPRPKDAQFTA